MCCWALVHVVACQIVLQPCYPSLRNRGHASEPFALASGINRMPLDLATPAQNLAQRPTLARSAHRGRTGNDVALADKVIQQCSRRLFALEEEFSITTVRGSLQLRRQLWDLV